MSYHKWAECMQVTSETADLYKSKECAHNLLLMGHKKLITEYKLFSSFYTSKNYEKVTITPKS